MCVHVRFESNQMKLIWIVHFDGTSTKLNNPWCIYIFFVKNSSDLSLKFIMLSTFFYCYFPSIRLTFTKRQKQKSTRSQKHIGEQTRARSLAQLLLASEQTKKRLRRPLRIL